MPRFSSLTLRRHDSIIPGVNSTSRAAHGFTLIELLVVISILGIILAFLVPTIGSRITTNARRVATIQQLRVLRDAIAGNSDVQIGGEMVLEGFKNDMGRLPYDLIELVTDSPFVGIYNSINYVGKQNLPPWDPYLKKGWNGPYVREDGHMSYRYDAWGDTFRFYVVSGETLGIESRGPDQLWNGSPGVRDSDDIIVRF